MMSHTFAICAYKDSPYLDACIHSLKRQSVKSKIILCTSTPSPFLEAMAKIHDIPLYVRDGKVTFRMTGTLPVKRRIPAW